MILYDQNFKISMLDFGIQIPVFDTRASNTFDTLRSHPILGKCIDQWHLKSIDEVITKGDLLRVHSREYVNRLFSDELEEEIIKTFELIDQNGRYYRYDPQNAQLPLTVLFERILRKVAGTLQCCRTALEKGFCFYFAGGMHHAQKDHGKGFCMLNDIVIAARKLQAEQAVEGVWIIDVDAHKGDGTAALTQGDESIRTLSIHMADGWPLNEAPYDLQGHPNPSFTPSDIDIHMPRGKDHLYVKKLQIGLAKMDTFPIPDLAIVVSGADPYKEDELPSTVDLQLSLDQLMERDMLVYDFLKQRKIPSAYLMAGGYGENAWKVYARFLTWALPDVLGKGY